MCVNMKIILDDNDEMETSHHLCVSLKPAYQKHQV